MKLSDLHEPNRDQLRAEGWHKLFERFPIRILWVNGEMVRIDDPCPTWASAPCEIEIWLRGNEVMSILVPRVIPMPEYDKEILFHADYYNQLKP